MLYPKKISDKIKLAISNSQTPKEILCKYILWQFSDIKKSLTMLNKDLSIENFLSVYMQIDIKELNIILEKLEYFKDKAGKDIMQECLSCRI